MIARRSLIGGLLAGLAAPAIVRTPGLLMPVRRVDVPWEWSGAEIAAMSHRSNHYTCINFNRVQGWMPKEALRGSWLKVSSIDA